MCIIIAKDKNNRLPSKKELKECFKNNHDGAGFMYVKNKQVVIDKGYMTENAFMNRYQELCKEFNNFKDKCLVIHCRIGTGGTNSAKNTHPYAITNHVWKLHSTYTKCNVGIAHNGIIRDYIPFNDKRDINDTQNFIMSYLYRIYKYDKDFYKREYQRKAIDEMSSSKFAILDKDENLYLIGYFIKDNNLSFSNTSYQSWEDRYKSYSVKEYHYNEDLWKSYYPEYHNDMYQEI